MNIAERLLALGAAVVKLLEALSQGSSAKERNGSLRAGTTKRFGNVSGAPVRTTEVWGPSIDRNSEA